MDRNAEWSYRGYSAKHLDNLIDREINEREASPLHASTLRNADGTPYSAGTDPIQVTVWFKYDFVVVEINHDVHFSMPYSEFPTELLDNKTLQRLRNESHAFHFHLDEASNLLMKGTK